jgi:hypothetical protein
LNASNIAQDVKTAKGMKIRQVDINELEMSEYQRPTNDRQVEKIAQTFDPVKAGLIVVSERDGMLFLVDGAHRVAAMRKMQVNICPAVVLQGLTAEDEADYFRKQGENTRPLSTYDRFKAGLVANDPVCIEIDAIVKQNSFALKKAFYGNNRIAAVSTVQRIYKIYGGDILDKTLMLMRETWGGYDTIARNEYLLGVAEFVYRFGTIDFIDKFKNMKFNHIYQRYQMLREGMPNGKAFFMALVQRYNEGMHNSKKKLVIKNEEYQDSSNQ